MSLKSNHRIEPICSSEQKKQVQHFKGYGVGTMRLHPGNFFLTFPFIKYADKVYDFKFKPSDVVVMTYPKCGTTWTQEIVWTMLYNSNFNHPRAEIPVHMRCPFLECDFLYDHLMVDKENALAPIKQHFSRTFPQGNPEENIFLQLAEFEEDPRVIKTHLPFALLNPDLLNTSKVIFVARNPKSAMLSYLHHSLLIKIHSFVGTMDDFLEHFLNESLLFGPFWGQLKQAWDERNHPNLLFLYFEDMKENPKKEINKIQSFLGINLSEKQLEAIIEYTSFSVMKKRNLFFGDMPDEKHTESIFDADIIKKGGNFFRKGESESWKYELSAEHIQKLDSWTKEHAKEFGPQFKYQGEEK